MRIVIISSDQYTFFVDTVSELAERGHEIYVFCSKEIGSKKGIPKIDKKNVHINKKFIGLLSADFSKVPIFLLPLTIYRFKNELKKIKPDILHAFNLKWSGWVSAFSDFHPFILSGLGSDILIEQGAVKNLILKLLRQYTLKKADIVSVVSKQMFKQVKEVSGENKIFYFSHGVNTKKMFKILPDDCKLYDKLKIDKKEKIIFSPRYIRAIYQIKQIIKAFNLLVKNEDKFGPFRLILGGAKDNDPEYFQEVINLINKLKLKSKISFTGRLDEYEWNAVFLISDVIVSYPTNDGLPATVLEAMYLRVPLILSKVPSLQEVLEENKSALFCNSNDYYDLYEELKKFFTTIGLAKILTDNAFLIFEKKGSFLNEINSLEKIYAGLINDSNN